MQDDRLNLPRELGRGNPAYKTGEGVNMRFPEFISFTITNSCNLRCRMCGQWSEKGYVRNCLKMFKRNMELEDWRRLVDEASAYDIRFILIRGGEPFLCSWIIELLQYINSKGIFISIDTNGTILEKYASDLVQISNLHITFSVDGPEEIHDQVRGVKGCFKKIKENVLLLSELEKDSDHKISKSICFTISPYSYKGLGGMPDVARSMSIAAINIVPYYYVPEHIGEKYEKELNEYFNCQAFSWRGFHHDNSGIDLKIFNNEYKKYIHNLNGIYNFPYMDFNEDDYGKWFTDTSTIVGSSSCMNIEDLIDIQPNGDANFCVDFPDYCIGNVKDSSIQEVWNSRKASRFRNFRRKKPLSVCYRCGAKYISEIKE